MVQIIHYCSYPKPWETADQKGDLEMMWWQKYIEMKTSAGVSLLNGKA